MNPRTFLATAAVVAATTLIAACGGDDSGSTAAQSAPAQSAPAATGAANDTSNDAPTPAAEAVDACTLLTTDDVAQLFPKPTSKTVDTSQAGESTCRWEGVAASDSIVPPDLVLDIAAMPKDFPVDQAKQSLTAEGSEDGNQVISDLGDLGIVKSAIDGIATVTWIQGPYLVSIDLSANGAETQHDAVVTTARAASARIG
jgi:hypothetical protein